MKISRISRSLVVVIFVAVILFVGILDFKELIFNEQVASKSTNIIKLFYIFLVIILVLLYVYIKDKLYKKKIKRKVGLVFRYVYVSVILVLSRILTVIWQNIEFSTSEYVTYIIVTFLTGILIKKIIFNVSKSDILSVLATFAYSLLPVSIIETINIINANVIALIFLSGLFVLQVLVDELKQRGIKTKKYVVLSLLLGFFIGLSMIFGISFLVWIIFAIVTVFIASDLDNTHINFPKKVMSSITQKGRENLYKIERININKLFVSICLVFIVSTLMFFTSKIVVEKINIDNYYANTIINLFKSNSMADINRNFEFSKFTQNYINFISFSKTFYMFCIVYILFMEILAMGLRRRYDTKSTMIKLLFLLILNSIYVLNLNLILYQPLLTALLILICIVNTSNIYLNREERIKMLVA